MEAGEWASREPASNWKKKNGKKLRKLSQMMALAYCSLVTDFTVFGP
jgi:hypothetical protein